MKCSFKQFHFYNFPMNLEFVICLLRSLTRSEFLVFWGCLGLNVHGAQFGDPALGYFFVISFPVSYVLLLDFFFNQMLALLNCLSFIFVLLKVDCFHY